MLTEEQRLIEELFQRLKQTEKDSAPRDIEAEQQIQKLIQQQPVAPYYMTQSILIQEAALNKLNQQIQQLQNKITELKAAKQPLTRRFLNGFFGNNRPKQLLPQQPLQAPSISYSNYTAPSNLSRSSSFMSGALQTAAGVAGGMVLGNLLTNMFHHSAPEEIMNIIDNPSTSHSEENDSFLDNDLDAGNLDIFNNVDDHHFFERNDISSNNDYSTTDFNSDDDNFL